MNSVSGSLVRLVLELMTDPSFPLKEIIRLIDAFPGFVQFGALNAPDRSLCSLLLVKCGNEMPHAVLSCDGVIMPVAFGIEDSDSKWTRHSSDWYLR